MLRGEKKFICDVCRHTFLAPDIKWQGTPYSQPMPCPRCGSCHTMPKSFFSFIDKFIYKAINNLPHEMSAVFYLYLKGYAYEEIAHLMSIPLGTVKSRIFCTKKRLQAILKPIYEDDSN